MSGGDAYERAGESAAISFLNQANTSKPFVTEKDLYERFLLTLRAYHLGEEVNIMYWLDGLKSDGTRIQATVFQPVQIINDKKEVVGYVPPINVDPDKILPEDVLHAIPSIMYRYSNLEATLPGRGEDFLKENLIQHVRDKEAEKAILEESWDNLFASYGLEPVYSTKTNQDNNETTNELNEGEFDVDFL